MSPTFDKVSKTQMPVSNGLERLEVEMVWLVLTASVVKPLPALLALHHGFVRIVWLNRYEEIQCV